MKGKSEDEVQDGINNIISNIVDELISEEMYDDHQKAYDIIKKEYMTDIYFGVEEEHPPHMIVDFVIELIKEEVNRL